MTSGQVTTLTSENPTPGVGFGRSAVGRSIVIVVDDNKRRIEE